MCVSEYVCVSVCARMCVCVHVCACTCARTRDVLGFPATYPGRGYLYSMVLISSNTSVTTGPSEPPAAQQTVHQGPRDPESHKDTAQPAAATAI